MQSGLDYRPELDGLRAVAVVSVILFHLGLPYTPGGFVGVDVFFVLSGYLITRQIAWELREGRFSLLDFYDRRIRRLFPALFVMLFVSTIIALFVLLPRDLDGFGESLVAAATSISNFYFWSESGYFAPAAETIPLLHTWSLAVEEQFYLLFPLMLMLVWRWRQAYVAHSLIALAILSFAISVWAARHTPDAAFYLLPSRAWELLVGSLLALAPARQRLPSWLRTAALNLGLAGIAIAVLTFHTRMPFPGFAAALQVFACALIIWAGHASSASAPDGAPSRSLVVSLLALRPMVFVGLISYSLYLWHWPIIVFVRHLSPDPLTTLQAALLAIATFAIAYASWRYVEQPLRLGGVLWPTSRLRVRYSSMIVCSLAFMGITLDIGNGFPWLQSKAVLAVVDDEGDRSPLRRRCHIARADKGRRALADTCGFGSASGRHVVVLGDSHGAELSYALSEVANEGLLQLRQVTASGCPPALGFTVDDHPKCARHTQNMVDGLADGPRSTILITAHYFEWGAPGRPHRDAFWLGIEKSVATLRRSGHDVILLGGWPPHTNGPLPHALAREIRFGRSIEDYSFAIDQSLASSIDDNLRQIAERHHARYLPLLEAICGGSSQCRSMIHGQAIYFDRDHLSVSAARQVVGDIILPAIGLRGVAGAHPSAGK